MNNSEIDFKAICRGDRQCVSKLKFSPAQKTKLYHFWYEDYVNQLEMTGQRFPDTVKAIAEAIGIDRQHLYKNQLIQKRLLIDMQRIGVQAKENAEKSIDRQIEHTNSRATDLQSMIDHLNEEKKLLTQRVKELESEIKQNQERNIEELGALNHMFKTGRRVLL